MAAAGGGPVRLRLLFDYPPPGSPGCALCWLLLEPSQVRLVTDLVSLIRHRFGFSRRARLSLFLEGALLPPTESARLVRDNDSLRVKLEEVVADDYEEVDDGFSCTPKEDKKRHRQKQEEEEFSRNEEDRHKREKKKNKHNPEYSSCREETSVDIRDCQKRYKKRKRKEEVSGRNRLAEGKEESSTDQSKKLKKMQREKQLAAKKKDEKQTKAPAAKMALEQANESIALNSYKNNTKKITTQSRKKRVGSSDSSSTSSDSDSSELNVKQNKSSHKPVVAMFPKDKSQAAANSDVKTVVSNKVTVKSNAENSIKTAISKNAKKSQSSSSDSDSSTEDEKVATAQDSTAKEKLLPNSAAAVKTSTTKAPKAKTSSSESDSSDSETLVIKKPTASAGLSNSIVRNCTKQLPTSIQGPLASPGRGRGRGTGEDNFWRGPRGRGFRGMMRGQGRGRGANPGFFYNYGSEGQKQRQLNEAATNTSVLVQNPVEVPKRDYSVLPLLAAPPQVGERIAFKRLELTENYTPEVSDYKEGKIISWNADKKQIELEILSSSAGQLAKEPGKFDLVYQSADGAELIEYAVPQDTKITESWDALIEPRLIVEPPVNGSSIENGTI
ncbi:coilin isoform X1 [Aquila chrysaetos chrysaetos]|uniref:Coilin n=1 Tax=Aquila chrysaetos chrysaetos TaxID=223781 RepID=A0A663E8U1_AQUCH|nr:coilin isoform X1 [Aquila chrysaetos chrysaetos]XP_040979600.1 coilin isoform X1 [Aquila chrysaetos chrysaetos]